MIYLFDQHCWILFNSLMSIIHIRFHSFFSFSDRLGTQHKCKVIIAHKWHNQKECYSCNDGFYLAENNIGCSAKSHNLNEYKRYINKILISYVTEFIHLYLWIWCIIIWYSIKFVRFYCCTFIFSRFCKRIKKLML